MITEAVPSERQVPAWAELWLSINGLDAASAEEQAEIIISSMLDGLRVGEGNREMVKDFLRDHLLAAEARGIQKATR
jgi:hypothetical protein